MTPEFTTLAIAASPNLAIVVPLMMVCLVLVVSIPVSARLGNLSIPKYGGLFIATLIVGMLLGQLAGAKGVRGTPFGVVVSVTFFLLMAVSLGSVISIFVFREPKEG